jgi:hypothetical protein
MNGTDSSAAQLLWLFRAPSRARVSGTSLWRLSGRCSLSRLREHSVSPLEAQGLHLRFGTGRFLTGEGQIRSLPQKGSPVERLLLRGAAFNLQPSRGDRSFMALYQATFQSPTGSSTEPRRPQAPPNRASGQTRLDASVDTMARPVTTHAGQPNGDAPRGGPSEDEIFDREPGDCHAIPSHGRRRLRPCSCAFGACQMHLARRWSRAESCVACTHQCARDIGGAEDPKIQGVPTRGRPGSQ